MPSYKTSSGSQNPKGSPADPWTEDAIRTSWRLFSRGIKPSFADRVEQRLVAGASLYGNKLLNSKSAEAFKRNFDEEMLDAAAYLWMLATVDPRTEGLKNLLDDVEYVSAIINDPRPHLGYAQADEDDEA